MKRIREWSAPKITLFALLVLMATGVFTVAGASYSEMRTADRFLHDVMDIREDAPSSDVLKMLFDRYGSHFTPKPYAACSSVFVFNNRYLTMLHLAPRTEIGAAITFRDDHVSTIGISYDLDSRKTRNGIGITKTFQSLEHRYFVSATDYGDSGRIVQVHLIAPSKSEETFVLSSINLRCLVKVGGCSGAHELAPLLYQQAPAPLSQH